MPCFATVYIVARQHVHARLSAAPAIKNLLDHQYITGFTPTPNIGNPKAGSRAWFGNSSHKVIGVSQSNHW
jgi:hypothetical protein